MQTTHTPTLQPIFYPQLTGTINKQKLAQLQAIQQAQIQQTLQAQPTQTIQAIQTPTGTTHTPIPYTPATPTPAIPPWLLPPFGGGIAGSGPGGTKKYSKLTGQKFGRYQDPAHKLTGKSKYSVDMNKLMRKLYGNWYT